jgi:hypothetical protein
LGPAWKKIEPLVTREFGIRSSGGDMGTNLRNAAEQARTERIRALAQRCRDLSEMTAIPDVTRELVSIADELEKEADLVNER